MNYKEEHISRGYFVKLIKIPYIRGLIVEFPKNIFLSIDELKLTYELDENMLNIYNNGSKVESIECPNYALRYLVSTDITLHMLKRKIDLGLSRGFDMDGNALSSEEDKLSLSDMIQPSKDSKVRKLEYIFNSTLTEFKNSNGTTAIPEEVVDGFNVVINRYIKGTENE